MCVSRNSWYWFKGKSFFWLSPQTNYPQEYSRFLWVFCYNKYMKLVLACTRCGNDCDIKRGKYIISEFCRMCSKPVNKCKVCHVEIKNKRALYCSTRHAYQWKKMQNKIKYQRKICSYCNQERSDGYFDRKTKMCYVCLYKISKKKFGIIST